jgi:hypothetical protein
VARAITRRVRWSALALALVLVGAVLVAGSGPATAGAITSRGPARMVAYGPESTRSINLNAPTGAQAGDVLVAAIGFGLGTATRQPTLSPPPGWTLVNRTNKGTVGALAVYWHVSAPGEQRYTWTTDVPVGASAVVAAFAGVDRQQPIDAAAGRAQSARSASVATPSVTTSRAETVLVSAVYGVDGDSRGSTWSPPSRMTELGDASNRGSRSGSLAFGTQAASGATGTKTATASTTQDYAVATLVALRPGGDTRAPAITSAAATTRTARGATIVWATDEPADSQVQYGTSTAYGHWSLPDAGFVRSHTITLTGLQPNTWYHLRVRSRDRAGNLGVGGDVAFRTAASDPAGPIPVIVDTDIFSDADDVGALATAFGLQRRGEARVLAIGVNTRTDRPAVARTSWRCAAAVAQFYGSGSVPIGTHRPDDGTDVNTDEFAGPCSRRAASSTPAPDTAVRVFRRALAGRPDGTVAMVEAGYSGNLSDLLDSPGDSISPLTGRELVARKVRVLVIMGGGYPSRDGENNLRGDFASAQQVADDWPTRIVWSGYEVGDPIHTGDTISTTHPASSPVRIAYESYVGPRKWIPSYDLTAVYHAIRPNDSSLGLVGPGRNRVTDSGGNQFTSGSGNQWYLRLNHRQRLEDSIESLLGVLP